MRGARSGPLRALVVTVVHPPEDARIRSREIAALVAAGWEVELAAPFRDTGTPLRDDVVAVDLPRAVGRRRLAALRAARRVLRGRGPGADVVLLHDPELLLALPGARLRGGGPPAVVWDVHEDAAAAMVMKPWLPAPLRGPAAAGVTLLERTARGRVHLLLAEEAYRDRFGDALVVPNLPRVPRTAEPPGDDRAVYVGTVSLARGATELVAVGRALRERTDGAAALEVVGAAHPDARPLLEAAAAEGDVVWCGPLPHAAALARLDGALAGLSLLHDQPNYRHSLPSKVAEYLAHGVPAVTTPLPLAADLVRRSGGGAVVPFGEVDAVVEELLALRSDPERRTRLGSAGHAYALQHLDWAGPAAAFEAALRGWALEARARAAR